LTPELRAFVAERVDGFEELAVLVALSSRGGECSTSELASATRQSASEASRVVERLRERGLLAPAAADGQVRLAGDDPRLAELCEIYQRDPVVVLRLLNELAIERVRGGATRAFADAFLLRRNKPDG
jgi:DNA-binding transcriptional ArsR family regulator